MNVEDQIKNGIIVCPASKKPLKISKNENLLRTVDDSHTYSLINNTPILLKERAIIERLLDSAPSKMLEEYEHFVEHLNSRNRVQHFKNLAERWYRKDLRDNKCIEAFQSIFDTLTDESVAISVGGGPNRAHNCLTNINLSPFTNVDVVGDAHNLPYADGSVDAIHCEAVLEHLHSPTIAASEMFRVLKKDGKIFVVTPFMQPYHGYPCHYQNFTLSGQVHIFEQQGFVIEEQGTCVGPGFALSHVISFYIKEFLPFPLSLMRFPWNIFARLSIRQLDRFLNKKANSHKMASTTFVVAKKV